ncbi:hypothetical protein NNJEOMEG_01004 [Fundidesulfovibrio magnetotacticus]|uniref:Phosphate transport regulator n=1 Tax=Fundidesulfovibrio magnetotacticus TaxID=2730080 RepID=A0A6V8LKE6_9BACT|nr:DUF47 family protein [Fundidesulfovibrio magnetotacticus]GFK93173.1 hypothetical protein NNJEOMEG_01004 [Fundidesulfovibrio magnetotacticus]
MFLSRLMVRVTGKSCLPGLLEHYAPVAKAVLVVEAALKEYAEQGHGVAFQTLCSQIDALEGQADKIKRRIRNHLPRDFFMEVDKVLFLNYTRSQDNILDSAQDAMGWLGMRRVDLPKEHLDRARELGREACRSIELLGPALQDTVDLIQGRTSDRSAVKDRHHQVRLQHHKTAKLARAALRGAYEADADFRDVHVFEKLVEHLGDMSHNAEGSADILRAMIAR